MVPPSSCFFFAALVCVCVCVCVRARARVCACVRACALIAIATHWGSGAFCLILAKHTCLVDVGKGEQKVVKRDGGAERQWRLTCLGSFLSSFLHVCALLPWRVRSHHPRYGRLRSVGGLPVCSLDRAEREGGVPSLRCFGPGDAIHIVLVLLINFANLDRRTRDQKEEGNRTKRRRTGRNRSSINGAKHINAGPDGQCVKSAAVVIHPEGDADTQRPTRER
jgi:hypothetical protein